jgi:hypothetical protein
MWTGVDGDNPARILRLSKTDQGQWVYASATTPRNNIGSNFVNDQINTRMETEYGISIKLY